MSSNGQILILDDEEMVRLNLVAFLEDEGFETLEANNAEEALELLGKERLDLAIVDLRLPTMDGNQFIELAHQRYPNLKFIIHTGSVEYNVPKHLKEIGISDAMVMFKPVMDMGHMVDQIHNQLHTA